MRGIYILFLGLNSLISFTQQKVNFESSDGLIITADLYLKDKNLPFILLFHQAGSSRGEYIQVAQKLLNLDYNCLAVDLRSGGEMNFIKNETAVYAEKNSFRRTMIDAQQDIHAAINYVLAYNSIEVILMGSSFSASLCMITGKNNNRVNAVIALSPGEYFSPDLSVKDQLKDYDKPMFIAVSSKEYNYIVKMVDFVPADRKVLFRPKHGTGEYGSAMLITESKDSQECWFQLSLFFRKIRV